LAKPGNKAARKPRGQGRRQWAAAVVRKAAPAIEQSLIEAAASLGGGIQKFPDQVESHGPSGDEDESLAALLLRLLRTPEPADDGDPSADLDDAGQPKPSLG
jgi:hypothetical protein